MARRLHRRRRARIRPATAALTLLFLTACAAGSGGPNSAEQDTAPTSPPQRAATPPPAQPPPVNDDPAQLLGLAPNAVDSLLGEPVRVRRDNGTEIRQYRADVACQLDAFIYRDSGGARVRHVELRDGAVRLNDTDARTCMRRLLAAPGVS